MVAKRTFENVYSWIEDAHWVYIIFMIWGHSLQIHEALFVAENQFSDVHFLLKAKDILWLNNGIFYLSAYY